MLDLDLKTLRDRLGWTQEKMGEHLGVDRSRVSRIENGEPTSGSVLILIRRLQDDFEAGRLVADSSPSDDSATSGDEP